MAVYDVTLVWKEGRTETLQVDDGETVVEAARSRDVILPVGCRDGVCGTCAGLILDAEGLAPSDGPEGVFAYRQAPRALESESRDRGFVLLCIAEPRANCRLAVGAATWSRREESPWI